MLVAWFGWICYFRFWTVNSVVYSTITLSLFVSFWVVGFGLVVLSGSICDTGYLLGGLLVVFVWFNCLLGGWLVCYDCRACMVFLFAVLF